MTSKVSKEKFEMPVILYEDTENGAFSFPYIEVLEGKEMPKVLFMFEYKHTGETEPNDKGKEVPVIDQIPHKFVDMEYLKSVLDEETIDRVRTARGLRPLKEAQILGKPIVDKVLSKIGGLRENATVEGEKKKQEIESNKNKKKEN